MADRASRSPKMAPEYAVYRDAIKTIDGGGPYTQQEHGINMNDYRFANIQVVVGHSGDNPNIKVMFWSEEAGAFIDSNPAASSTGLGAGKSYEVTVECRGRIMLVEVTGTINASSTGVKVLVSGYSLDHTV